MGIADPTNRPYINKGVVVKHNANQRYTTDAVSNAIFKELASKAGAELQHFANRSDILGGGTLGNVSNNRVALNTVDIGLPQFAMHSSFETAGVKDTEAFADICKAFYECSVVKNDNVYTLK
jgi:aspartyl aminopeptidase